MSETSPIPSILKEGEKPEIITRRYHGKPVTMWHGRVDVERIHGWADNPRIELDLKRWKIQHGDLKISDEELFEIMKSSPEVDLKRLRDNILKNGLRNPIILAWNGKLLDGNRRFFAVKLALEGLSKSGQVAPEHDYLRYIPAYVLTKRAGDDDEQLILVEENFAPSLKREWPDYVKAARIKSAREEDPGITQGDIARRFGWSPTKVRETLRTLEVIDDFHEYAVSDPDPEQPGGGGLDMDDAEAEKFAFDKYQFFNEAQKSLYKPLLEDDDSSFRTDFYRWLQAGKFASFPEVRVAHKAWNNPGAKSVLDTESAGAGKKARTIVEHDAQIVKTKQEAAHRIDAFAKFLDGLQSEQIQRLSDETLQKLEQALQAVKKMARSVREGDSTASSDDKPR